MRYVVRTVRASAVPTALYVAGTVIENAKNDNKMIVLVDFTKDSLTTAELKIEFSPDGTNYYQEAHQTYSTGVYTETLSEHQFGASGSYRIPVDIKDRYIKISVKGTGTIGSSAIAVKAVLAKEF